MFNPAAFFCMTNITYYPTAKVTTGTPMPMDEVFALIRGEKLAELIGRLRALAITDPARYADAKKHLPAVAFAGEFSRRGNAYCTAASGLMVCDLDHLSDAASVKDLVAADHYVKAAFISPSGAGVKFLVAIPQTTDPAVYSRLWAQVAQYFAETYNLTCDASGKNIERLCFLSHDPAMCVNASCQTFPADLTPVDAQKPHAEQPDLKTHTAREQAILAHFQGVTPTGNGYLALCPAHNDHSPSLSITFKDGRTLLHCFSGCQFEDVLKAAGLKGSDCAPPKTRRPQEGEADALERTLREMGVKAAWNVLTDRIEVNGSPLTDQTFAQMAFRLLNDGFRNEGRIQMVLTKMAADHPRHPVREFLRGLKWDGTPRIAAAAAHLADAHQVMPLYLRKWMIGACAKALTGTQNPVLVLTGPQGIGKHFFCKWLCSPLPDLFIEGAINPDSNDCKLRLTDRWIWEVSELGSTTRRADIEALKSFLTLESVVARRPYGRFDVDKPALASFLGSVNPDGVGFLTDSTGNRRFRIVDLTAIRREYAQIDVRQMWAEAMAAMDAGETAELAEPDERRRSVLCEEHEVISEMQAMIADLFEHSDDPEDRKPRHEILQLLYDHGYKGRGAKNDGIELSKAMDNLGYMKFVSNGKRGYKGITL